MSKSEEIGKSMDEALSLRWRNLVKEIEDAGLGEQLSELIEIQRQPWFAYQKLVGK